MRETESLRLLPAYALYVVSVFQPCGLETVVEAVKSVKTYTKLGGGRLSKELEAVLSTLSKDGFLRRLSSGQYVATVRGIRAPAEKKLAFTRDKFRLYFLKEALKKRGE